jgi:putative methyltransferase (TIGR04325 family)
MTTRTVDSIAARIPPLQRLRERRYERIFRRGYGQVRGLYPTFEAARRSAPPDKPLGHNWAEYARHHLDRVEAVQPYDYPVLFWLERIFRDSVTVFDFGGNVGVHYHAYQAYLTYPSDLKWTVCELPELVNLGEQIARERGATRLAFTTNFADVSSSDIVIAAGVLQYVEDSFSDMLASAARLPTHLLLNKLPLYDGETFITLQNGPVYVPQYVWNRREFLSGMERLGYAVVDAWSVVGFSCHLPFYPGHDVPHYTGLYLKRS